MVSKKRLKEAAKSRGFTLTDLAKILGLKYPTFVARINKGYMNSNDIEALIAILKLSPLEYESIFFDRLHEARKLAT